ncbi:MAG: carboxynorspermidine decarboxylase [Campylobacterales bacterium]|nr:carboxynorspermidine decarboxylase [Campylobacterales bacterium]
MKKSQINTVIDTLNTPAWIIEEALLRDNLETMQQIKDKSGAKILLALKGYAVFSTFNIVSHYLDGCCASGLHEALLAHEEFGKEVHTYSPAFKEEDIETVAKISHHLVFNSIAQFQKFAQKAKAINPSISLGLRINPEFSSSPAEQYNPCGLYSRLGTTLANFDETILSLCDGLHFHALCEQDSSALAEVLEHFEAKFGAYIPQMKWINFGGGHHITRKDYDAEALIEIITNFKAKYNIDEVYLEPGEAIGWEIGVLVASVVDIVHNGINIAILDICAEAHMPDTIIMPYRANIRGSGKAGEKAHTYRITGNSCLAGDVMGDYSFDAPLEIGDKLIFEDQAHYTIVKATTFNGVQLPSINILRDNGELETIKKFGYEEFRDRLS